MYVGNYRVVFEAKCIVSNVSGVLPKFSSFYEAQYFLDTGLLSSFRRQSADSGNSAPNRLHIVGGQQIMHHSFVYR